MKMRLILVVTLMMVSATPLQAQVLVTLGDRQVTSEQLEQAIQSSPFATQFPTLDEQEQARIRGDILQRLVNFEVLLLEAERLQLDRSPEFQQQLKVFETGLLSQRYLQQLREHIDVPVEIQDQWRTKFGTDLDALAAARSLYIARRYETLKSRKLAELKRDDGGLDETLLWARAATNAGIEVDSQVKGYRRELLVQSILQAKEREWIPNDAVLRDYYQTHPEIGYVPERRHIGQIVVDTRELAERLRQRILAGESLFKLASEYSIDPYGREHAGDMGWLKEGQGMPRLEQVLASLPDQTVSDVIKTPKGYHLVMIVGRKPSERKAFASIEDRVRRALLAEKLTPYLKDLLKRYPPQWHMVDRLL